MLALLKHTITKNLQRIFWIYWTDNFVIESVSGMKEIEPAIPCTLLPITLNNYFRVKDFGEESRVLEYREKLTRKELGLFCQSNGRMGLEMKERMLYVSALGRLVLQKPIRSA